MSSSNYSRVAVIGRPNVGKSTLFNKLTRTRKALVKNQPGVTRDLLVEQAHWWGYSFEIMDTGGITDLKDDFSPLIKEHVLSAVRSVGSLVVIVDGRVGLAPEDRDIIRIANESGKPFVIVVNKIDQPLEAEVMSSEFYEFGKEVIPAAFERDFGIDQIVEWIKVNTEEVVGDDILRKKICVIGKPNAGKSSLCNYLLKEKRLLVSEVSGTTADSVAVDFDYNGDNFTLVDTAGLRRNSKREAGVERLSAMKTQEAVRKSDIVLILVDILEGVSVQEAKMVEYCADKNKPFILVANKVDIAEESIPGYRDEFREKVSRQFHFLPYLAIEFVSAKSGKGVEKLFRSVSDIYERLHTKISTSKLNNFFMDVIRAAPAPVFGTKDVKFYYLTQTGQVPPSFIAFANEPRGVTPAYRRFLTKRIAEAFNLQGIPIRIFIMKKRRTNRNERVAFNSDLAPEEIEAAAEAAAIYELDGDRDEINYNFEEGN